MRKAQQKALVLLVCTVLLATIGVSGTVAFLADQTNDLTNTFTPVQVDTMIVETFSNGDKSGIAVLNKQNDKNVPVYVRVAIVGNWVDEAGNIVKSWNDPISVNVTYWTSGNDGFYYYNSVLAVGAQTENLLGKAIKDGDIPAGAHHLEVVVVHQAIQAAGWPAGVDSAQEAFTAAAQSVQTPTGGQ